MTLCKSPAAQGKCREIGMNGSRLRRRRAARLPGERRRERSRRMVLRTMEELIPVPDPVSMAEIARIEGLARAAGMSYGRYVAAHTIPKGGKRAAK